jgi:hypothetical protein
MYYLLSIIIILLVYVAFFTPERRRERGIKRVQRIFNTPLPEPPLFKIDDPRNETHPDEMVAYQFSDGKRGMSHRKLAVMNYKMKEDLKV